MCWRVRENTFYDYKAFLSLKVSRIDDYLDISSSERVDLDVFLTGHLIFHIASVNHLEAAQIIGWLVLLKIYLRPFVQFLLECI